MKFCMWDPFLVKICNKKGYFENPGKPYSVNASQLSPFLFQKMGHKSLFNIC